MILCVLGAELWMPSSVVRFCAPLVPAALYRFFSTADLSTAQLHSLPGNQELCQDGGIMTVLYIHRVCQGKLLPGFSLTLQLACEGLI